MDSICSKCGTAFSQIDDSLRDCPVCGEAMKSASAAPNSTSQIPPEADEPPSAAPDPASQISPDDSARPAGLEQLPGAPEFRARRERSELMEFSIWMLAFFFFISDDLFRFISFLPKSDSPLKELGYFLSSPDALKVEMMFIFLTAFRLVFGMLPLSAFGKKIFMRAIRPLIGERVGTHESVGRKDAPPTNKIATPELFLRRNSKRSKDLSMKIFYRAGVYLFFGAVIAFTGIFLISAIFDGEGAGAGNRNSAGVVAEVSESPTRQQEDTSSKVIKMVPRTGALIFIELIAFFFLKQYRVAMDEFRYYEAIARQREELIALYQLLGSAQATSVVDLVKSGHFFSKAGILEQGQISEWLESSGRLETPDRYRWSPRAVESPVRSPAGP